MENSAGAMPNSGPDNSLPSSHHEEAAQTMTFPPQQERVLVVDDEFQVRYLLKRLLEREGYSVLLAEDGRQAVRLYRQHGDEIDLVLLDMSMPQMDGPETFERLRELDPQVRVLVSSGHTADSQVQEILAAGVLGFLQKPYHISSILDQVRQALDAV
jgi:two-component system cell cycle sensor histidine kinase/response regulator CckA